MDELQPYKQQGWSAALTAAYLTHHRDWRAVEAFYTDLLPREQDDSSNVRAPVLGEQQLQDKPPPRRFERTTYKVQVSYLGSSFSGWVRQPGKVSVEETLAAAIAAAGLTAEPLNFVTKSAKAAAKQARRAALKQSRAQANSADGQQRQHHQQLMHHQHKPQHLQSAAIPSTKPPSPTVFEVSASSTSGVPPVMVRADVDGAVDGAGAAGGPQLSVRAKLPVLPCGGRTDAGVSAAGQVVSFYSWHPHTSSTNIVATINQQLEQMVESRVSSTSPQGPSKRSETGEVAAPTASAINRRSEASRSVLPAGSQLRVVSAQQVDGTFHAAFSAHWRRELQQSRKFECLEGDELLQLQQAPDVDPEAVNTLLQQLQGRTLDYDVYARQDAVLSGSPLITISDFAMCCRDTPAGKDCNCILHTARATVVALPPDNQTMQPTYQCQCLCIELVGNRFLRRMVRVLVATAVREALPSAAAAGSSGSPLEAMMAPGGDRRVTAAPAPALGLCFAAAGY
eukprot:gene3646-3907_t